MNNKEFIKKSKDIHKNKYDYSLVEYKNAHTKVKIICKEYGIFEQTPNSHLNKHGCSYCFGNNKKDTKQFIKESKEIHKDRYDYSILEYKNCKTKVKIICKEHGIFEQNPNKHLIGQGCPMCYNKNKKIKPSEQFIKESIEIHGNKYDYSLVEYKGSFNDVKIICKKHGIFKQKPVVHINGCGCKKCSNEKLSKIKISNNKEFIKKSKDIHKNKYDYSLVEYKNAHAKVKIICKEHSVFEQTPNSHLNGTGCPNCQKSKGELKIKEYLDNNKFIYNEQYKFKDCRNILPLPFDFHLPEYNICIEYDGEQHFKRYKFEKDDNNLNIRKLRDKIKTDFCKKNNIKLIRIKYTDFKKIESILNKNFKF